MACFLGCFSAGGTMTTEAVQQSKVIDVRGYRILVNRIKPNEHVTSATFQAGGYNWHLRIYPNGSHPGYGPDYVSVFVELMTPGVAARASAELSLVPWTAGSSQPRVFKLGKHTYRHGGRSVWGVPYFATKTMLETPTYSYLRNDTIRIKCTITVFVKRPPPPPITVPPSELSADLGKLMVDHVQGTPPADVLILVGAESFGAHSIVLWMRCRELYYQITSSSSITISDSDVQPAVFRDLLHYVYTESFPAMDDLGSSQKAEKLRGLLAAAVRYKVNRLKLICESKLCTSLDVSTVVATLVVAEQLQLTTLRSACIKFIGSSQGQIQ